MFQFGAWPTESWEINQYFGENRYFDYTKINEKLPGHEGTDIRAASGTKIFVVADGTVVEVSRDEDHAYGLHVRVQHVEGYLTIYAHLSQIDVWESQEVVAGQQLGLAGSTGNSTGPHLHLTLKQAGATFVDQHGSWPYEIINPERFLMPLLGFRRPAGPYIEGWAYTAAISVHGEIAQANSGINLRAEPHISAAKVGVVPHGTALIITGAPQGNGQFRYYPVQVPAVALAQTVVKVPLPEKPVHEDEVAAWAFSAAITIANSVATAGKWGLNLRDAPRRNAGKVGVALEGTRMTVTGAAQGEYTPVLVDSADITPAARNSKDDHSPDTIAVGAIKIGIRHRQFNPDLHAAARGELVWLSAEDDFGDLPQGELTWGLQLTDSISADMIELRNTLAHQHVIVAIPTVEQLAETHKRLIAADVVVALPEDATTVRDADGVLLNLALPILPDERRAAMAKIEMAIAETRYQPMWIIVEGGNQPAMTQAANFLVMWGALQQHPIVRGVVLQLSDALSAADAQQIAEIIGWR